MTTTTIQCNKNEHTSCISLPRPYEKQCQPYSVLCSEWKLCVILFDCAPLWLRYDSLAVFGLPHGRVAAAAAADWLPACQLLLLLSLPVQCDVGRRLMSLPLSVYESRLCCEYVIRGLFTLSNACLPLCLEMIFQQRFSLTGTVVVWKRTFWGRSHHIENRNIISVSDEFFVFVFPRRPPRHHHRCFWFSSFASPLYWSSSFRSNRNSLVSILECKRLGVYLQFVVQSSR